VSDESFHRLPEQVTVPSAEIAEAISHPEQVVLMLERSNLPRLTEQVDLAIGVMARWLWPLLRDIDEEGDQ
jgi:hypothetical protein